MLTQQKKTTYVLHIIILFKNIHFKLMINSNVAAENRINNKKRRYVKILQIFFHCIMQSLNQSIIWKKQIWKNFLRKKRFVKKESKRKKKKKRNAAIHIAREKGEDHIIW